MSSRVLSNDDLEVHQISAFPYRSAEESGAAVVQEPSADDVERESYERGYREGQAAALEAADQRLAPARERLEDSIRQLSTLQRHLFRRGERDLVKLAIAIAAKVVRREVRLDPDIVSTLVRVSLEKVSQATTASVRLNPDDYRHLAAAQADGEQSSFGPGVVLVEDVKVEPGGCVIETDAGNVDATVDVQLQEITENLLSTF